MKFIDFFAGIGGFHSGLEKAGMECIGWCEFDKFAQKAIEPYTIRKGCGLQMTYEKLGVGTCRKPTCGHSGFPAKTSQSLESKKELNEEQGPDSFMRLCVSLTKRKKVDPNGLSVRTLKICYLLTGDEDSLKFSLKWGGEGTLLNGVFTTQKITEFRKTESESTLLDIMESRPDSRYYLSDEKVQQLLARL